MYRVYNEKKKTIWFKCVSLHLALITSIKRFNECLQLKIVLFNINKSKRMKNRNNQLNQLQILLQQLFLCFSFVSSSKGQTVIFVIKFYLYSSIKCTGCTQTSSKIDCARCIALLFTSHKSPPAHSLYPRRVVYLYEMNMNIEHEHNNVLRHYSFS